MSQNLMKQMVRKQVWNIKKRTVVQVLTPRCRRDGEPKDGRFTKKDIDRIIRHTASIIPEVMAHFTDLPNIGNYTAGASCGPSQN